ncbi:hypothetical protein SprV_0401414300 [Sparganum proliferum]
MDTLGVNSQESESLTKKRKLYSDPIDSHTVPSPSSQDITMVAAGERTGPFPLPQPNQPTHPAQLSNALHSYGPSPLLAPELYEPGQNIREWLQDLSLLLVSVPPHEHVCYLLRFLSPPARRLAFDAGLTPTSDFRKASEVLLQLFTSPDASAIANQRFATLRQRPGQSVDDFAHDLRRLAAAAFANLPETDRDRFILHQFITGLRDRTASGVLLLHPPTNLSAAIQQCRLYEECYPRANGPTHRTNSPTRTTPPPNRRSSALPVRFPDHNPGCPYCAAFGPQARRCGHNQPRLDLLADYDCVIHTKSRRLSIPAHPDPSDHTPPQNLDLIYDAVVAAATLEPFDIDASLPPAETVGAENRNRLRKLLLSFPGLFAWSTDTIGRTRKVQHVINTGDAKPIWQPPRRLPVRFRAEVDKIIDELLKANIIQPSSSPWASPIALVPKKDGSLRLCIDYRRLNAVTVRDSFPLPRLDDTLDSLGGAAWFSTLDLNLGYWQVEIDPKDRPKTAFIVPQGLFEFQTLPFGLCNAAATFQRLMYQVLRHLVPHKCLVYLDDIIVFGPDVEQHNRNLREVLEALRAAGLTLNPAKCTFLRPEVQFLGHTISPGRIAALPDRLQQIRTWPTPANQTQLRSFLGLASYYRRFIRNFAHIARPLHKLTKKGRDFKWSPECEEAFTSLRAALVSAPLLALPNVNPDAPPFILDTDASGFAIGAVLSQTDAQGVEHPICFASNTLTKAQRNYCTFRRELLAIITFVRQFKHLLIGRRFILRTDHKALQWLQSIKDPMDQLARWQEFLQDFDFDCQFRPGHKHGNADALSRPPDPPPTETETPTESVNAIIMSETTRHTWADAQRTDPDTATIYHHLTNNLNKPREAEMRGSSQNARILLHQWPHLTIDNDILFLRDPASKRLRPVVPGCLIEPVLAELHAELGHCGQKRTELAARARFWWPQLRASTYHFCQSCDTCASFKSPVPAPRAPMQPMTTGFPGEGVGLDIIGPLPISVRGYEYILVMVDYFTKWVEAVPLLRQDAVSVANAVNRSWICRWGAPLAFHTDCGSNFDSRLFQEVCRTLDVNKTRTTPYHPEGNGLVERTNRTLHNLLLAFCKDSHEHDWDTQLPFCLMAYRSSTHASTGFTPHYLWTGRELRLPVDLQHPLDAPDPTTVTTYATQLREIIRTAYNAAREVIGISSAHQKTQSDRHSTGTTHQIGDLVLHHNPIPPRGVSTKFHYPWQGPFVVLDTPSPTTYLIRDASQPHAPPFTTNFNKLKPYRGRLPICTPDSLPIIPYDQVPPAAVEVTIPSPIIPSSTEDSAAPSEGGYVTPQQTRRTETPSF